MNVKYTKEILQNAADNSKSVYDILRFLGLKMTGGNHRHITNRLKHFGVDISHYLGKSNRRGKYGARKSANQILIRRKSGRRTEAYQLRRALIEKGVPHVCKKCGIQPTWQGENLVLEVDHINNNWLDDRLTNLRFLCPNCHSQR